jgi:hypothetical protein
MQETQQSTKVERHIKHLQEVHDDLDREIEKQYKEYGNDNLVQTLKKKKLKLKDEIEHLREQNKAI